MNQSEQYKLIQTPRNRFLYQVLPAPAFEWQGMIGEIDFYLAAHPRLKWASKDIIFYFFENQDEIWVGREVIGTYFEGDWPNVFEGDPGEVFSFEENNSGDQAMTWDQLLQKKDYYAQKLGSSIAPVCRIRFAYGPWPFHGKECKYFEFFKETED